MKEKIIVDLKNAWANRNKNKAILIEDLIKQSGHNVNTIVKHFGSVYSALKSCHIEINKQISNDDLLDEFVRLFEIKNRIPTKKEVKQNSKYSYSLFVRRFGSLGALVKSAGLESTKPTKSNDKRYIAQVKARKFKQCSLCLLECRNIINHFKLNHVEEYYEKEMKIVDLFLNGNSFYNIAKLNDIFCSSSSVARVVRRYVEKEKIEKLRIDKIRNKLKTEYAFGNYDWIIDLNINRNVLPEERNKNSIGLKNAYKNGKRKPWNIGNCKENDDRLEKASESISKALRAGFDAGEIEKRIGSEASNWNMDREAVANRYRLGLGFSKSERNKIKDRAGYRCECCGRLKEDLEAIGLFLECDHIIPIFAGGVCDWENNGKALCSDCHNKKTLEDMIKYKTINKFE